MVYLKGLYEARLGWGAIHRWGKPDMHKWELGTEISTSEKKCLRMNRFVFAFIERKQNILPYHKAYFVKW